MARASDCTLSLHCKWQRDRKYVWKQYGLFSRQLVLTESMSSWIVLFFSIAPGFQMILVLVDKSFLWKWYQTCLENIFCRSLSNPLLVVRNVAPQIKWLSCMFTSIFGDISMTIQAETLLKGEGWRCPFTQERAGVIHQPGCCPFSTAVPSSTANRPPPPWAPTPLPHLLYQRPSFCHSAERFPNFGIHQTQLTKAGRGNMQIFILISHNIKTSYQF